MNLRVSFISLNLIFVISSIYSQGQPPTATKGLGSVSCDYYGGADLKCDGIPNVPCENLPKECESIVIAGFQVDSDYNIQNFYGPESELATMNELIECGKKVYIIYRHTTYAEWAEVLSTNLRTGGTNVEKEMNSLKTYLSKNKMPTGIILFGLTPTYPYDSPDTCQFTQNFKMYLDGMKTTFPDLEIGLCIGGVELQDYLSDPKIEWIDFSIIDLSVDFYVLNYAFSANQCTKELRNVGVYPITGQANYTLEKMTSYLETAKVPKSKLHFRYNLGATAGGDDGWQFGDCNLTYSQLCTNPGASEWCADTLQTLGDKGKFAKERGVGFIAVYIDLDDSRGCCECGPFPGFYAILNGFNGTPQKHCPKFDRTN